MGICPYFKFDITSFLMNKNININKALKGPHFGVHLTLDGYNCPFEKLMDMGLVYNALSKLAEDLGMVRLAPPYVVRADGNDKKDPGGYSGFVIIAESHISIHTFGKRGFVSIDVYSCKDFDIDRAVSTLTVIFGVQKTEVNVIVRGKEYPDKDIYVVF